MSLRATALILLLHVSTPLAAGAQAFSWAYGFGGPGQDTFNDLVIGPLGDTTLVGTFEGLAAFASGYGLESHGGSDLLLRSFVPPTAPDSDGGVLTSVGGPGDDGGLAVDTDGFGGIWVAGYFSAAMVLPNGIPLASAGGTDALFLRLEPTGGLVWALAGADTGSIRGTDIAVEPASGACFGTTSFPGQAEFGSLQFVAAGGTDALVVKIDPSGNVLWGAVAGGPGDDEALAVAADGAGGAYVTGIFEQTAVFGSQVLTADTPSGFVARLDPLGNFLWAVAITSSDPAGAAGRDVLVLPGGACFVCGDYSGATDVSGAVVAGSSVRSVFAALLTEEGSCAWAVGISDPDGVTPIQLGRPKGTGQTTGHIADLTVFGIGSELIAFDDTGAMLRRDPLPVPAAIRGFDHAAAGDLVLCGSLSADVDFGGILVSNQGGEDAFMARMTRPLSGVELDLPSRSVTLAQNVPNPFNPTTEISYVLASAAAVRLEVFDPSGRRVRTLVAETQPAGEHQATWDGRDDGGVRAASGVYLMRLRADGVTRTRRAVLVK